ncbi:MAG: hypothetical protein ACRETT_01945 [Steroidobacteraceae bacterium]
MTSNTPAGDLPGSIAVVRAKLHDIRTLRKFLEMRLELVTSEAVFFVLLRRT